MESAKRTPKNSPVIHRWGNSTHENRQSAKRTTEILLSRPFHGSDHALGPALKWWATFALSEWVNGWAPENVSANGH